VLQFVEFGAKNVKALKGGWLAWVKSGGKVETSSP
jgi:3-mercaptopyruvate sulfurtransferase SseA